VITMTDDNDALMRRALARRVEPDAVDRALDHERIRAPAAEPPAVPLVPPDEVLQAQLSAALDAISEHLTAYSRLGHEHATVRQQRSLRQLEAVLVEAGRRLP
jgi:hypothetical protein